MDTGATSQGVVVAGAGGHALVCIEALRAGGDEVAGCVSDDGTATADLGAVGVSMLGRVSDAAAIIASGHGRWFVAIGDNEARRRVSEHLLGLGVELVAAVSPDAVVSPSARVRRGALVMPGAVVNAAATIGPGAIVNTGATVDHECDVGPYAHIAPQVALAGGIVIGESALIGIGARVVPGVRVGAGAIVGAGAVVLDDVAARDVVAGVPARRLRTREWPTPDAAAIARSVPVGAHEPSSAPRGVTTPNVLFVCTGNLCRSPLAEALLRAELQRSGVDAVVHSTGLAAPLAQMPDRKLLRVADELEVGVDVREHRSRQLTPEMLAEADLVLTMTAEHLEEIERMAPGYARAITLRTAAWRAEVLGGNPLPFGDWVDRMAARVQAPSANGVGGSGDIADPMGGRLRQYRAMGAEVGELVRTLAAHWSGR